MIPGDPFEDNDAAYVMGLLSESERDDFEVHLATCEVCAARVRQLSDTAGLLGVLTERDLLDPAEPGQPAPETLLPGLLRKAELTRRRQRLLAVGMSGLTAACLIALVVAIWPTSSPGRSAPQTMAAVTSTSLHATAAVSERAWGTEIVLDCDYPGSAYSQTKVAYSLTAIAQDGSRTPLGTWTVASGKHTTFTSGTALTKGELRAIEITRPNGKAVLSLNL